MQQVPLNTLSELEICRFPNCTDTGTLDHMLEIKIQCLLTIHSSEMTCKDLCTMMYVMKALRLFQLFLRHVFPRRNKHCPAVTPKPENGKHLNKISDILPVPSTVTGVGLNCGCKVNFHSVSKRTRVINPRGTPVSKVMICLSAFTFHVVSCLGNKSVYNRC